MPKVDYGDQPDSNLYPLLDELAIINQPKQQYLIDNLFPEDAVCLLSGMKGTYKSFFALDAALTMTHGLGLFHGHKAQSGAAIYFAGEGAGGLGKRIAAWRQFHKRDMIDGVAVRSPFWLVRTPINILRPEDVNRIIATIKQAEDQYECEFRSLWIDTVSRAIQGAKEDEVTWGAVIANCEYIKGEIGHRMSCFGIAHQGKDGMTRGTRGSSVAECNADAVLTLECDKGRTPDEATLHVSKLKDDEDGWAYQYVTCQVRESLVLVKGTEETEMQRALRVERRTQRTQSQVNDHPGAENIKLLSKIASLSPNAYTVSEVVYAVGKKPGRFNQTVLDTVPLAPIRVAVPGDWRAVWRTEDPERIVVDVAQDRH
jgi:hypothetical protein